MKTLLLHLLLIPWAPALLAQKDNTVNALLGDESFFQAFQQLPDDNTHEILRLQTHLNYVESLLRSKDNSHLNSRQKAKREGVLQLLHQYWTNGLFPKNYEFRERRPCFIDRDGNICAVGYLIEQTVGREVAEEINQKHQYDYLLDMNEAVVEHWASAYGLTLEECAMIQPAYGYVPPYQTYNAPVKASYGISSGVVTGINAGINFANLSNRFSKHRRAFGYIGLVTGTSQLVLGLVHIKKEENNAVESISYKNQNMLSYFNVAAGTTTIATSAFNLLLNDRIKNKRNAFNIYSVPGRNNKITAGLSFTRTL